MMASTKLVAIAKRFAEIRGSFWLATTVFDAALAGCEAALVRLAKKAKTGKGRVALAEVAVIADEIRKDLGVEAAIVLPPGLH